MNITPAKVKKEHIDFYNEYYKHIQLDFTSWYKIMLPELVKNLNNNSNILEVGCGQSKGLRYLVKNGFIKESNIYAIDQSEEAINFSRKKLPQANISTGDAYKLNFPDNYFDIVVLMEVIEHLEQPKIALREISRVMKPGAKLFISFPNYFNIPWLIVRVLAEKLNKPNWIVLQPVDRIYLTINIINLCKKANLKYLECIGSNYFPPVIYRKEKIFFTKILNWLKLNHLSFHPVLIFKK